MVGKLGKLAKLGKLGWDIRKIRKVIWKIGTVHLEDKEKSGKLIRKIRKKLGHRESLLGKLGRKSDCCESIRPILGKLEVKPKKAATQFWLGN